MRLVKGVYIDDVKVTVGGEEHTLHVWKNPETGKLFAIDNLEVFANVNYANDPYEKGVGVVFADTFTGLPK